MKYTKILAELYNQPLAIAQYKAEEIAAFLEARITGGAALSADEVAAMRKANEPPKHEAGQHIAVMPLFGTLHQHGSVMASGGTSTAEFGQVFDRQVADPEVGTILLHVNSPGGQVHGVQELTDKIYAARSQKRIVAAVNSTAASAGYWIASAAHEMALTPGGQVGSIGILTMHQDTTKAEEEAGIVTTVIATPDKKAQGWGALDDETRAEILTRHEKLYSRFVGAVARNRGTSEAAVKTEYGGGGMLLAEEALAAGMVDRIATIDQVIAGILNPEPSMQMNSNRLAIEAAR